MQTRILEQHGTESAELFRALSAETRIRILHLLSEGDMNINELGQALGIMQPTVSKHIQVLEQAGLITSEYTSGIQGTQKRCRLRYDRLIVSFDSVQPSEDRIEEVEMPIGLYSLVNPSGICGLANPERLVGFLDDPQSFFHPERGSAQLIWMSEGFIEYVFPNTLPSSASIQRLEFAMEISSEAPDYDNDYPSDITVWINNVEIGTWTSPGDFGGKRGRLNPAWWNDHMSQYGVLKLWSVDLQGSYVDGAPVSDVNLSRLMVVPLQPITIRIGVKPDAEHKGGFNLFGKGFGNYGQDLVMRLHYIGRSQMNAMDRVSRFAKTQGDNDER